MSTTFKEFLREQAAKEATQAAKALDVVTEWRGAVERLFHQIRAWLAESDPEGHIEIQERQQEIKEPSLGRYQVPRLDLHAFGKWIGIIPKSRRAMASARPRHKDAPLPSDGRVDITDELQRYVLYRFREGGRDEWTIEGVDSPQQVLDQNAFERALMSYLQ